MSMRASESDSTANEELLAGVDVMIIIALHPRQHYETELYATCVRHGMRRRLPTESHNSHFRGGGGGGVLRDEHF